jgi:hypothetical protein
MNPSYPPDIIEGGEMEERGRSEMKERQRQSQREGGGVDERGGR